MLRDGSSNQVGTWGSGSGVVGGSGNGSGVVGGGENGGENGDENGSEHEARCERVHRNLKRIVRARGALDAQECAALREAQRLMIWRAHGCASLVDYMERELGYTARAAVERLRVAKVIAEVPALGEAMNQGDLSFSGARELSRVITPETQNEWLDAAQDKNVRQIEELVSGHKPGDRPTDEPDPALKTRVIRHEVRQSVVDLERRARKALQRLRGTSLDDSDFMEACFKALLDQCEAKTARPAASRPAAPHVVVSAERTESTGRVVTEKEIERLLVPRYQVAVTVTEDRKQGWQHGAHGTTVLSPAEVERALCDCDDIGGIDDEPERAKRSIPKRIKRHVLHRDGYRCRVPGCSATANIDAHHVEFRSNGGEHTVANVITLCEGHHLAVHAGSLAIEGDAFTASFVFKPQHKLKIATRAVECAAALRKRGIAKELIKPAVEATRIHVGMQDLSMQHWIDIALTKLPRDHQSSG